MKLLVLLAIAGLAAAQERPAFEVASIKVSTSGVTGMRSGGGVVHWQGQSLRQLVQRAYRLHDYDYSGPGWLDSVYFDIEAKLPAGANFNQLPEMLQAAGGALPTRGASRDEGVAGARAGGRPERRANSAGGRWRQFD